MRHRVKREKLKTLWEANPGTPNNGAFWPSLATHPGTDAASPLARDMTRGWGRIGAGPYHSVKCPNNCRERGTPGIPGHWAPRKLVRADPLTARGFCLHNGFTMLRRFDRSSTLSDQTTRTLIGTGLPLKAAKDDERKDGGGSGSGTETIVRPKSKTKTQRPNLYRVLLLNDDYTPMEFVVLVLQEVFNKSREEATRIMYHVHQKGVGECGIYPYEVAETKVARVMDTARRNQHPLQCVMEKQ